MWIGKGRYAWWGNLRSATRRVGSSPRYPPLFYDAGARRLCLAEAVEVAILLRGVPCVISFGGMHCAEVSRLRVEGL
jgi:hypothetical protein